MSHGLAEALERAGAKFIVRGWLSSNNIVLGRDGEAGVVVDTGYVTHATQTVSLIEEALNGRTLGEIVNTHLHSDHCGGNHALQELYPGAVTTVPIGFQPAVTPWQEEQLSFEDSGQQCPAFQVDRFVEAGQSLRLGTRHWQVHPAPGHDTHAVMLFEPSEGLLISGDALWERRLAIIFPELTGQPGFDAAARTLDAIERLAPRWVLPGHGEAFDDVAGALRKSRERLDFFAARPERHRDHASRALVMFHMLEHRALRRDRLETWMVNTPIFSRAAITPGLGVVKGEVATQLREGAAQVIDSLLADRVLCARGALVALPEA